MSNVIDFSSYVDLKDNDSFIIDNDFELDKLSLIMAPRHQLDRLTRIADIMLNEGNVDMVVRYHLLDIVREMFRGLFVPASVLTSFTVRVAKEDDDRLSVLMLMWDMEQIKDMSNPTISNDDILTSIRLEVSTIPKATLDIPESWFYDDRRLYDMTCEMNKNRNFNTTHLTRMVDNIKFIAEGSGGFIRHGRSDDNRHATLLAFIPYTRSRYIQIALLADGTFTKNN